MNFREIYLSQFRNYERETISFHPHFNLFWGDNGHGKTNILEALYLLSFFRSFRPAQNENFLLWGSLEARLSAIVESSLTQTQLTLIITPQQKLLYRDGKLARPLIAHLGAVKVVAFTPLDLQLIQGSPEGRRKYLDRGIFLHRSAHLTALLRYQKALQQRNRFLLNLSNKNSGLYLDDVWEKILLDEGAVLMVNRLQFIAKLNKIFAHIYRVISHSEQEVNLSYRSRVLQFSSESTVNQIRDELKKLLDTLHIEERKKRKTLVGPHLDDLEIEIGGRESRVFASQGEQRSLILALKLAEVELLSSEFGEKPIFFLDDITSELDLNRKKALSLYLKEWGLQVFVTSTQVEKMEWKNDGFGFQIKNGKILERWN